MAPNETFVVLDSAIGTFGFVGDDEALLAVILPGARHRAPSANPRGPALDAKAQMAEYLEGWRTHFDVPLAVDGTPFQRSVWAAIETIPDLIGRPLSTRPVGQAVGRNPHPIIRPCHRVVAAAGIGGYDGRLDTKRTLLDLEGSLSLAEGGSLASV